MGGDVARMGGCIQGFGWKLKEKNLLGDIGVDGKILKRNLKKGWDEVGLIRLSQYGDKRWALLRPL
jgi:hypothetical protein